MTYGYAGTYQREVRRSDPDVLLLFDKYQYQHYYFSKRSTKCISKNGGVTNHLRWLVKQSLKIFGFRKEGNELSGKKNNNNLFGLMVDKFKLMTVGD